MLANYLKVAVRTFASNKLYASINVFALSIAMACGILAYVNLKFARSYDHFHKNLGQIYALRSTLPQDKGGNSMGITPRPLGPSLLRDVRQVKRMTRVVYAFEPLRYNDEVFNESLYFVDESFLQVFTFPITAGDPTPLNSRSGIVLSEETAKKFFGDTNPIGRTISLRSGDEMKDFTITAVMKDVPSNSSLQFDALVPYKALSNWEKDDKDWNTWSHETFIQVSTPAEMEAVSQTFDSYVKRHNASGPDLPLARIYAEPMADVASSSRDLTNDILKEGMHPAAILGPTITSILLLITACINFMNTSLAFSATRLKEVGVRKVLGGARAQLVIQFVGENLVLCAVALLLGIVLAEILVPAYSSLWPQWDLALSYRNDWDLFAFLGGLLVGMSLLSGAYPALFISRLSPVAILAGRQRLKGKNWLMQAILIFQFSLSMLTILTGIVFADNARFLENLDLGFDARATIVVPLQGTGIFEALRNGAQQHPDVRAVSGTRHLIGYNQATSEVKSQGREIRAAILDGDVDERQATGLKLLKGRDFDRDLPTDLDQSIIVSEKFLKELDIREPIGARISVDSSDYTIVGVMQDFYNRSVWRPAQPSAIRLTTPDRFRYLLVRADRGRVRQVNDFLKSQWQQLVSNIPYEGFYHNELIEDALIVSANIRLVFLCVSGAAISIAAMGLFALSSLIVVRRTKEIGIRKVLGAPVLHIIRLLNHQVSAVLIISMLCAATAGTFVIRIFLDSLYAYHIELQAWHYTLAGAIIVFIGFLSVSSQVYRLATSNPVEALRYE